MEYKEFLKTKKQKNIESGFDIKLSELNSNLFDFQKFIVHKALKNGKFAVFSDTGTGKTIIQLEWANQVNKFINKPILILSPLAVSGQTIKEGIKFRIKIKKYDNKSNIQITNYHQIENIDLSIFGGIVLDESSILKNETSVYRNKLIKLTKNIPYKLCCTATPSPNDPMELGNHAEFLDIIKYNEMLSVYFIHDGGETQKWRLKKHSINRFWEFVNTWAVMMTKPQDIGFEAIGYDLPPLNMKEVICKTPVPEGMLFGGLSVNATDFNKSLRETEELRLKEVLEIVTNNPNELFIIWTKQNKEADNVYKKLIKLGYNCRNVKGSDSIEKKENDLLGFAKNEYQILITKSKIAQFGLNYQNCNNQIFASIDFSFESTYQSIRRSYRFGQKKEVNIWLITTDKMINVIKSQQIKQKQFKDMQENMTKCINKKTNGQIHQSTNDKSIKNSNYWLMQGDCVQKIKEIDNNSIDLTVFSPPFAELYTYSSFIEDMGNSKNYDDFFTQFQFLVKELKRVMKNGRIVAIHCMDLPIQKGKEGYIGLRDFSGMIINAMQNENFIYHAKVTIWKDPVIEMQRTKALGLLHKQIKKDSVMSRVGLPDYVLFFRNSGENEIPIANKNIPVDLWQKIASPVWYDINYSRTLNYRSAKDNNDEKHICPLQLDTIERIILLYSNENETVFSPFGGIGSEGYQALKMNRQSISIELKESYFNINVKNHNSAIEEKSQLKLF